VALVPGARPVPTGWRIRPRQPVRLRGLLSLLAARAPTVDVLQPEVREEAQVDLPLDGITFSQHAIDAILVETDRQRAIDHFATTARYEWMFRDMGYRQESWPVRVP
jgi:hypothetical protein